MEEQNPVIVRDFGLVLYETKSGHEFFLFQVAVSTQCARKYCDATIEVEIFQYEKNNREN